MASPGALASRALARHDNPWARDDIRYPPTFEESLHDIQSLTRRDLLDFHKEFYGAGHIEFAAAGEFAPHAARLSLAEGPRGWHRATRSQRGETGPAAAGGRDGQNVSMPV